MKGLRAIAVVTAVVTAVVAALAAPMVASAQEPERDAAPADAAPRLAMPQVVEKVIGRGLASWYGPRFHGRKTASGERFDQHELTAAHRTLPFGTIVRVKSLVNGRTVDVRINDRGPHLKQRVIDLSRAAAQALGLLDARTGTKPVEISLPGEAEAGRDPAQGG